MSLPDEVREKVIILEDRLERAHLRRTGLPAGMLLFTLISLGLFWKDVPESIEVTAGLIWVVSYVIGTLVLLALNEVTSQRTIRGVEGEIKALRNPTEEEGQGRSR